MTGKFEFSHFVGHICTYKYKLDDGNIVAIDMHQVGEGIYMRWEFFKNGKHIGGWDIDGEEIPTHARVYFSFLYWPPNMEKYMKE